MGRDAARRLWTYERGSWSGPLVMRGGDEYGNRTLALRLPGGRALITALNVPLRRHRLPSAVSVDRESGTVLVEFILDAQVDSATRFDDVLAVNYAGRDVVSVELLSVDAVALLADSEILGRRLPRYVLDAAAKDLKDMLNRTPRST